MRPVGAPPCAFVIRMLQDYLSRAPGMTPGTCKASDSFSYYFCCYAYSERRRRAPSPRQRVRSKIVKKIDCDKCYDIGDTGWGRRGSSATRTSGLYTCGCGLKGPLERRPGHGQAEVVFSQHASLVLPGRVGGGGWEWYGCTRSVHSGLESDDRQPRRMPLQRV